MSPVPRIVLFDVMDTLVVDPFPETFLDFFDMELEEFIDRKSNNAWSRFEKAEIDEAEFFRIFFPNEKRSLNGDHLKEKLYEAYRWVDGMQELLGRLRERKIPLHAFSNYPHWYRMIEQKLTVSDFLEWSFVSWNTGHRKPEPDAYRTVLKTLEVPADELLFIDNRKRNVEAAREHGFQAHTFEDTPLLETYLEGRGLLDS